MNMISIAAIQNNPKILDKEYNMDTCINSIKEASANNAKLIIFPECTLTGYCFNSLREARILAEPIPGPSVHIITALCKKQGVYVALGLIEQDAGQCYNTVALTGPEGYIGKYRKLHLPFLGIDRYLAHGNLPLTVYETAVGKLGMNICFDIRFPEPSRVLALLGANLILLPTNWPQGAEPIPKYVVNTRAFENRVHYVAANRVGTERGFTFIGQSKIVRCTGETLVEASPQREEIIYASLDLDEPKDKHIVVKKKDEFEVAIFQERKPQFYQAISANR